MTASEAAPAGRTSRSRARVTRESYGLGPANRTPSEAYDQFQRLMSCPAIATVPPMARLTAIVLVKWCDQDGFCFPSVATIAQALHQKTDRHVRSWLSDLEDVQLIEFPLGRAGGDKPSLIRVVGALATPEESVRGQEPAPLRKTSGVPLRNLSDEPNEEEPNEEDQLQNPPLPPASGGRSEQIDEDRLAHELLIAFYAAASDVKPAKAHVHQIRELAEIFHATTEQITAAVAVYERRWPNARLTPRILAKHWQSLGRDFGYVDDRTPEQLEADRQLAYDEYVRDEEKRQRRPPRRTSEERALEREHIVAFFADGHDPETHHQQTQVVPTVIAAASPAAARSREERTRREAAQLERARNAPAAPMPTGPVDYDQLAAMRHAARAPWEEAV